MPKVKLIKLREKMIHYCLMNPQWRFLFETYMKIKNILFGASIMLDASTHCQLACPDCPTIGVYDNKESTVVKKAHLKFSDFKKLLDDNPYIKHIELVQYGEIFLNPNLHHIIQYAYEKNVKLTAWGGVNFNHASEEVLEALVKYRFRSMGISIDGASQETYGQYRINGNFDNVIKNIKKVNALKEKYSSKYPILTWRFIPFGFNEHEVNRVQEMARELNMRFTVQLNLKPDKYPLKNEIETKKALGISELKRDSLKENSGYIYKLMCKQLWERPLISADGTLLGCCGNMTYSYGNVFEKGLKQTLKDYRFQYAKKVFASRQAHSIENACTHCAYNPVPPENALA